MKATLSPTASRSSRKNMKATIRIYSTNATVFFNEDSYTINYDLGVDFFDDRDEMYDFIDDKLDKIAEAENYDEIRERLAIELDKFIALHYDVVFNDDNDSSSKGFNADKEYCIDYIKHNNGTNESYFADYKGGIVEVVCVETGESVYTETVK